MAFDVAVMSFDAMWLLVLCHVTWRNAMSCDVSSCYELSCVVPCNGTECYELKMPLVVRSRCVVRSGSVTMWWSKVFFCTTKYYSVLQRTTPVLLRTTEHYCSTTKKYFSVLLQHYASTTLYYKVLVQCYSVLVCTTYSALLQYYSVLQSTTPVPLSSTKYYDILLQ